MIDNNNLSKGFRPDHAGLQRICIDDKTIRGEWVYGWPSQPADYRVEKAWIITEYPEAVEVTPDSLCQFAGYSTIGHPLCEGDIVHFQFRQFPYVAEGELEYDWGSYGVLVQDGQFVPMKVFTDSMFVRNKYDVEDK